MLRNLLHLGMAMAAVLLFSVAAAAQDTAQKSEAGKSASNAPSRDVSGIWNGVVHSDLLPADVTMTPWAQAKWAAVGNKSPQDPHIKECAPIGPTRYTGYIHPLEIIPAADRIFIFYENDHVYRAIWMDGRALPADLPIGPTYMGYSVGHWDGDDLVVETGDLNDKTLLDIDGHPHSDALHLTERYHRVDHDKLTISTTFDDPKAYSKPWTVPIDYRLQPKWEIWEDFCILEEQQKFRNTIINPGGLTNVPVPVESK